LRMRPATSSVCAMGSRVGGSAITFTRNTLASAVAMPSANEMVSAATAHALANRICSPLYILSSPREVATVYRVSQPDATPDDGRAQWRARSRCSPLVCAPHPTPPPRGGREGRGWSRPLVFAHRFRDMDPTADANVFAASYASIMTATQTIPVISL